MSLDYINDNYQKKARAEGYRARSYFKLEEINQKFNLIRPGLTIVDLGAAPGGWLQYCQKKMKSSGKLLGIDLQEIEPLGPFVKLVQKNIFECDKEDFPTEVNLVLSDMAPKTTGTHQVDSAASASLVEQVLYLSTKILLPGGALVAKYLQGSDFQDLQKQFRGNFEKVKLFKPKSSRDQSTEIFFIGQGLKPT